MTDIEEILTIANNLANQGKKPSVALVKTKLNHSIALPTIISVLKTWQHQPNYQVKSSTTNVINETSSIENVLTKEKVIILIDDALAPIKQELDELKQLLRKIKR